MDIESFFSGMIGGAVGYWLADLFIEYLKRKIHDSGK